ncbi:hypothetical protein ACVGXQ_06490, partial [Enterobacter intestinihominis]
ALHRPAILRVPATAIRLLMGESSVLVLGGPPARPKTQEPAGFCLPGFYYVSYKKNTQPTTKKNFIYRWSPYQ